LNSLARAVGAALSVTTAASAQWVADGELPTGGAPRVWSTAVQTADGSLFVIGGTPWVGMDLDGTVHHRTLAGVWTTTASLNGPMIGVGAGVDNLGRLTVFGGRDPDNEDFGECRLYDPVEGLYGAISERSESWPAAFFSSARDAEGRLYVLGGNDGLGGQNRPHASRFDGSSDHWDVLAPMPLPVGDAAGVYDGQGHVLVIGGLNQTGSGRVSNVARYDISTNSWSDTAIPDLPVATSGLLAVLGADDRVYAIGGITGPIASPTTVSDVWVLAADGSSWVPGHPMLTPRSHFAAVLDTTRTQIVVIGGSNDAGGTALVETLFTPICPGILVQPRTGVAWRGGAARFAVEASGGGTLNYQWRRDGIDLVDGPTGTGSIVAGSRSPGLTIDNADEGDLGAFDVVITNSCGTAVSDSATFTLRSAPTAATRWRARSIHPAWSPMSSYAYAIDGDRIVGATIVETTLPDDRTIDLYHPLLWDRNDPDSVLDLSPPGSPGGAIYDIEGDHMVGWFWHPYDCYGGGRWWTCAWQSAGYWSASSLEFHETHSSGSEYDAVYDTDGVSMVGSAVYDGSGGAHFSRAVLFSGPNYWPVSLHPTNASNSSASAIEGAFQYGSIYTPLPGPSAHAARWNGSAASFVDLHPQGYSGSSIGAVEDAVAYGSASVGDNAHAGLWIGTQFFDLNPLGATASTIAAVSQGVQAGQAFGTPGLWFGTAQSFVPLNLQHLPEGISTFWISDIQIEDDRSITLVGSGYRASAARYEALILESTNSCTADLSGSSDPNDPAYGVPDGTVDAADFFYYLDQFVAANLAAADLTGSSDPNDPGYGTPDGAIDAADFFYYLDRFVEGCP
jgi:hypothetical protein